MSSTPLSASAASPLAPGSKVKPPNGATSLETLADGRPRFHGCSSIRSYEVLGKLGEGTFGEVHKARSHKDGHIVALKKILMHNEKDGFPITALREIKLLKMLSHTNVLKLEEMAVERKGEARKKAIMYMVTPYMDHDLSGLLENPSVHFTEPQIKCYMLQLLEGVRYLHANKILHRDMKAANLLINNHGILQIADFGLARPYDDAPPEPGKGGGVATRDYTTVVVTRWYRPPELLLQLRRYTSAIDMWGVGCVFGEMFRRKPILTGNSDLNQLQLIFDLVGSPTEDNMPGWNSLPGCEGVTQFMPRPSTLGQVFREQGSSVISLLNEFLTLDWRKRINAIDALEHPYFKNNPLPVKPGDIPQFESSHELDRRKFKSQKAALPPAPAGGTVGMGPNGEWARGSGPGDRPGEARHRGGQGEYRDGRPHFGPPPYNGYDQHRAPPPPPPQQWDLGHPGPPPGHRPAWARDNNNLPPRPPPRSAGWGGPWGGEGPQERGRGPPPQQPPPNRRPPGDSRSDVRPITAGDTYVPSYGGHGGGQGYRGRDDGHRRDDRDQRGRHGDRRDYEPREPGRRRSRSPDYHRDRDRPRERDRDRERIRDRDRDLYRR